MIRIKRYVIRHKPTGYFIPVKRLNGGRGGSFVEPRPEEHLIRLFPSLRSATSFLAMWLKGQHMPGYDEGYAYVDHIKPVPTRIKSEMEIIEAYMDILT